MSRIMRKNRFYVYANNQDAGQPKHPRSLISAFIVRYLIRIMSLGSKIQGSTSTSICLLV